MREVVLSDLDRLAAFDEADRTFQMTEEAFRAFYEETARSVWGYLARATGDGRLAEDLLQETYYRFLRARARLESEDHRRHYLFRIATNLVRDRHRRPVRETELAAEPAEAPGRPAPGFGADDRTAARLDLTRAMSRLTHRERSLLWLAYVQGLSHQEIAGVVGVKTASLKVLLFRARRRLVSILEGTDAPERRS